MLAINVSWLDHAPRLAASRSVIVREFAGLVSSSDPAESEYLLAAGRLVRCGADATLVDHAVRDVGRRLSDPAWRIAFELALDFAVDRCLEAIDGLWFNRRSETDPWIVVVAIAREEIAGLGALARLAAVICADGADVEALRDLELAVTRAADQVDAAADDRGTIELALRSPVPGRLPVLALHAEIAEIDADTWWWSMLARSRHRAVLQQAASVLADDRDALLAWVREQRRLDLARADVRLAQLDDVNARLVEWIDRSYRRRHGAATAAEKEFGDAIWSGFVRPLIELRLRPRSLSLPLRRAFARMVTLALTLLDRTLGHAAAGRRVPRTIDRLGWAAHAWRLADPRGREAAAVFDAFQRRFLARDHWDVTKPAAVAEGCIAVAVKLAREGYPDDARQWLGRAEPYQQRSAISHAAAAGGWLVVARAYLRGVADATASLDAADKALALSRRAQQLSADSVDGQLDARIDGRAHSVRALARAALGDADGADADLRQAIEVLARLQPEDRSRYALMEQRCSLLLRRGDVPGAAKVMREYIAWCRQGARHVRDRVEKQQLDASAAAVTWTLGAMLLDRDDAAEGVHWLFNLAQDAAAPQRWREEAESLLRARDLEPSLVRRQAPGGTAWLRLEDEAKHLYRVARAAAPTERALAISRALAGNAALLGDRPSDRIARTRNAHLWIMQRDPASLDRARRTLDKLDDEAADDSHVIFAQGRLALASDDPSRACDLFHRAYDLAPRAETAILLARALLRAGRPDEALDAAHRHDDDPVLNDLAGLALLAKGDLVGAWTSMVRAGELFAEDWDASSDAPTPASAARPRRVVALARRLAALGARVPPQRVRSFLLNSDLLVTGAFVSACTADLRFTPALRDAIVDVGATTPALRRTAAQYAMGFAIYEETAHGPDSVVSWLEGIWERFGLAERPGLIAQCLAGAKGVYARALRSALEGESGRMAAIARRWILPISDESSVLVSHVATLGYVPDYYATAERLVRARPRWTREDFVAEARTLIRHVRSATIAELGLRPRLDQIAADRGERTSWASAVGSIEGTPALETACDLGLVKADDPMARTVVFAAGGAIALAIAKFGAPASVRPDDDHTTLIATWRDTAWPEAVREACITDQLWLRDGALGLPIVATRNLPS